MQRPALRTAAELERYRSTIVSLPREGNPLQPGTHPVSRDAIEADRANLLRYVGNCPTGCLAPDGHRPIPVRIGRIHSGASRDRLEGDPPPIGTRVAVGADVVCGGFKPGYVARR